MGSGSNLYEMRNNSINDDVVIDINQIRADLRTGVIDPDNYIVFPQKGNDWIDEESGKILRGSLYLDVDFDLFSSRDGGTY